MFSSADDLEALVMDIGSCTTRIGFAGEDRPKYQVTTSYGLKELESQSKQYFIDFHSNQSVGTISNPLYHGIIQQWDAIEHIIEHASTTLQLKLAEHPILSAEPAFNTREARERLTELVFEKYDVPACFLAKTPVLSCYANGKATGLVVDIGGASCNVVPVHDGYALQKSMTKHYVGGNELDKYLHHQVTQLLESTASYRKSKVKQVHGLCEFRKQENGKVEYRTPAYDPSYIEYWRLDLIRQCKETTCRVSDIAFNADANVQIPKIPYELPDGTVLQIGTERFTVPEVLFTTQTTSSSGGKKGKYQLPDHPSLQKMVCDAANNCEMDLRRDLFHNVVLSGGSSCFENAPNRLERELANAAPSTFRIKVIASHPNERKLNAWLGGSILASLGSFHEMWISKSEYAEHGASLVQRKCP